MSEQQEQTMFDMVFIGEYVEIIAKFYQTYRESSGEAHMESVAPASVKGYIIDHDGEWCYLGDDPASIDRAIKFEDISYIEIISDAKLVNKLLKDMPVPDDDIGKN